LDKILENGIDFMLENGLANKQDKEFCESSGKLLADSKSVSQKAKKRGKGQLGTIGAGNHFVEIQKVAEIFDEQLAKELNLFKNQVVIMIHCGSRGLGHQVATDYISMMLKHLDDYQIKLIDQQLACAPFNSSLGQNYFKAMNASANFAWANRQLITQEIRKAWQNVFGKNQELSLVYDVAHNIGKIETYDNLKLLIHRKGATRSFSNGSLEIPKKYQNIGQPVLIPGSMGTSSYVLIGKEKAIQESFGSTCHGAGRTMSRTKAKKMVKGENLKKELANKGIAVEAGSYSGLAEEAPVAYKNVSEVVEVVDRQGLAKKVVKLIPLGVIKG
jgi:tRNA-splicing ligase RtcB